MNDTDKKVNWKNSKSTAIACRIPNDLYSLIEEYGKRNFPDQRYQWEKTNTVIDLLKRGLESECLSVNQTVSQSDIQALVEQTVNQSDIQALVEQTVKQSVNQDVSQPELQTLVEETVKQSVKQTVSQSELQTLVEETVKQSVNQLSNNLSEEMEEAIPQGSASQCATSLTQLSPVPEMKELDYEEGIRLKIFVKDYLGITDYESSKEAISLLHRWGQTTYPNDSYKWGILKPYRQLLLDNWKVKHPKADYSHFRLYPLNVESAKQWRKERFSHFLSYGEGEGIAASKADRLRETLIKITSDLEKRVKTIEEKPIYGKPTPKESPIEEAIEAISESEEVEGITVPETPSENDPLNDSTPSDEALPIESKKEASTPTTQLHLKKTTTITMEELTMGLSANRLYTKYFQMTSTGTTRPRNGLSWLDLKKEGKPVPPTGREDDKLEAIKKEFNENWKFTEDGNKLIPIDLSRASAWYEERQKLT